MSDFEVNEPFYANEAYGDPVAEVLGMTETCQVWPVRGGYVVTRRTSAGGRSMADDRLVESMVPCGSIVSWHPWADQKVGVDLASVLAFHSAVVSVANHMLLDGVREITG